jgi:hypothetical protein
MLTLGGYLSTVGRSGHKSTELIRGGTIGTRLPTGNRILFLVTSAIVEVENQSSRRQGKPEKHIEIYRSLTN